MEPGLPELFLPAGEADIGSPEILRLRLAGRIDPQTAEPDPFRIDVEADHLPLLCKDQSRRQPYIPQPNHRNPFPAFLYRFPQAAPFHRTFFLSSQTDQNLKACA